MEVKWERHCALEDIHDDSGYCEHKIKKYEEYYIMTNGNSEKFCAFCTVLTLMHDYNIECVDHYIEELRSSQ